MAETVSHGRHRATQWQIAVCDLHGNEKTLTERSKSEEFQSVSLLGAARLDGSENRLLLLLFLKVRAAVAT